jgi:hypothetical protein
MLLDAVELRPEEATTSWRETATTHPLMDHQGI